MGGASDDEGLLLRKVRGKKKESREEKWWNSWGEVEKREEERNASEIIQIDR